LSSDAWWFNGWRWIDELNGLASEPKQLRMNWRMLESAGSVDSVCGLNWAGSVKLIRLLSFNDQYVNMSM
jgi:hypothetical protein